jgi:hypothetical protein
VGVGDVRDAASALSRGDFSDAALSAVGIIPIAGDAVKSSKVVVKFMAKQASAKAAVYAWLAKNFTDNGKFKAIMRIVTSNKSDDIAARIGDDGMREAVKNGNDPVKLFDNLAAPTVLKIGKRALSSAEEANIRARLDQYWSTVPAGRRAEAIGVETAVEHLQSQGYRVLYVGRPGDLNPGPPPLKGTTAGPDIIAVQPGTDLTVVIEAKGTASTRPLQTKRLRAPLKGAADCCDVNSRKWLREKPDRYLSAISKSGAAGNADHAEAAQRISQLNADQFAPYGSGVVLAAPGGGSNFANGAEAYTSRMSSELRTGEGLQSYGYSSSGPVGTWSPQ